MIAHYRFRVLVLALCGSLTMGAAAVAFGQSATVFDLSFGGFTSGGGASAGGTYSTYGVFGQPLAGTASGGSYSLTGGLAAGANVKFRVFAPFISSDP